MNTQIHTLLEFIFLVAGISYMALAIYLYKDLNHVLLQLLTFNTPGKEFRAEQKRGTLCSEKTWRNRSSDS